MEKGNLGRRKTESEVEGTIKGAVVEGEKSPWKAGKAENRERKRG